MYNFQFEAVKKSPHNIQTILASSKQIIICFCLSRWTSQK